MTNQEYIWGVLSLPAVVAAKRLAGTMDGCRFCNLRADNNCGAEMCEAQIYDYLTEAVRHDAETAG